MGTNETESSETESSGFTAETQKSQTIGEVVAELLEDILRPIMDATDNFSNKFLTALDSSLERNGATLEDAPTEEVPKE